MTNRPKEAAIDDFREMIMKSWTYERMTEEETGKLFSVMEWAKSQGMITGTHKQRWMTLSAIYHSFLAGIGYSGPGWRENETITLKAV